jgi:hypothetical protein
MKKLIIFSLFLVFVAGSFDVSAKVRKKDLMGEWKYEAPTAPYGYEKGVFVFFEKDSKLKGELKLADGSKINFSDVKIEGDEVLFTLYVEGTYITAKSKIKGDSLSGKVSTPDGEIEVSAKKVK